MTHYQRLTVVTVAATLVLIGIGALVRVTGSGLGCPDWPLCHGGVVPPAERAPVIEWSHRTVAAATGGLIVLQAAWTLVAFRRDRPLAVVAALTVPLLAVQAFLGREAVVRAIPPSVVAVHMVNAQLLLALLGFMAVRARRRPGETPRALDARLYGAVVLVVVTTGAVMVAGAYVVANGASLGCSTWPGCQEAAVPFLEGTRLQDLHWLHRALVGVAALSTAWLWWSARRRARPVASVAGVLLLMFLLQALVGAGNIWSGLAEWVRVAHLVLGSAIWVSGVGLWTASRPGARAEAATAMRARRPARERVAS